MIDLMLITNDPDLAVFAAGAGVTRVFVDLESLGKHERQGHLDTYISSHGIDDVARMRAAIPHTPLLVRVNPWHAGSADEVEAVLEGGADLIMLPMFTSPEEVAALSAVIAGRAGIVPLVETPEAAATVDALVRVPGVYEVFIGLNDLHLGLGLDFMFEPLANGLVDRMAAIAAAAGLRFGVGGVARVGEGLIPGEMVLGEHVRLGSSSVILSRTFHRAEGALDMDGGREEFALEVARLRAAEQLLRRRGPEATEHDRALFAGRVAQVVEARRRR
jgi:hypothetical protein